jgi:hypothetical protein
MIIRCRRPLETLNPHGKLIDVVFSEKNVQPLEVEFFFAIFISFSGNYCFNGGNLTSTGAGLF